jgi:hypothetical protein
MSPVIRKNKTKSCLRNEISRLINERQHISVYIYIHTHTHTHTHPHTYICVWVCVCLTKNPPSGRIREVDKGKRSLWDIPTVDLSESDYIYIYI